MISNLIKYKAVFVLLCLPIVLMAQQDTVTKITIDYQQIQLNELSSRRLYSKNKIKEVKVYTLNSSSEPKFLTAKIQCDTQGRIVERTDYDYYNDNNLQTTNFTYNTQGLLVSETSSTLTKTYTYSKRTNLIESIELVNENGKSTTVYKYNPQGVITGSVFSSSKNKEVSFDIKYTPQDTSLTVVDSSTPSIVLETTKYNRAGKPTYSKRNGAEYWYAYNTNLQLTSSKLAAKLNDRVFRSNETYLYDENTGLLKEVVSSTGPRNLYEYSK
jgi:YD repeat-containing protein